MLSLLLWLALVAQSAPSINELPVTTTMETSASELYAQVAVNGVDSGLVVAFQGPAGNLAASGDDLRGLGIEARAGASRVRLRDIPGLSYHVDEAAQTVAITVAAAQMRQAEIVAPMISGRAARPPWGGLLNYSLYADANGMAGATSEVRLFGPVGIFSSSFLMRRDAVGGLVAQRLETAFVQEDPSRLRRLTIGDFVASDGSADGAIRGAGIQLATDFELQPDLITAPTPRLTGGNGVPSTVDLYVDGVKRLGQDVGAGRFAVSGVPMVDGAGQVSLLVKDALGHESVQQLSFYTSHQLLRPGLSASSMQFGLLRADAFAPRNRYGAAFASGTFRRSLSEDTTGEIRASLAGLIQAAGVSFTTKIAEWALFSASGDLSSSRSGQGSAIGLSFRHDDRRMSIFAVAQKSFSAFATLAGPGTAYGQWRLQAGGSWQSRMLGGVSISATLLRQDRARLRILAASWSRPITGRIAAFMSVVATHSDRFSVLATAGITIALSPRSAANVLSSHDGQGMSGSASWSRSIDPEGGVGWRGGVSTGAAQTRAYAGATVRGADGEAGADVQVGSRGVAARAFASGALVWLGDRPQLAAEVGQSFALVETGQPDIGVTLENRPAGRTRRNGSLFLPNLPPNTTARIGLDYDGIDLDHEAVQVATTVRTRGAGGAVVDLLVRPVIAVTIHVIDPLGAPLPAGAIIRRPDGREDVVGYDGVAYLTEIGEETSADVIAGDAVCKIQFRSNAHDPVVCH